MTQSDVAKVSEVHNNTQGTWNDWMFGLQACVMGKTAHIPFSASTLEIKVFLRLLLRQVVITIYFLVS